MTLTSATGLFIDTSGWAEPLLRTSPDHARMQVAYQQAIDVQRPLVTTNYILAELVALLTARTRASRTHLLATLTALKNVPTLEVVHVSPDRDQAAWALLHERPDKTWSLVDAASFVVMRDLGLWEALTTDHHFAQAGFRRIPEDRL